MTDGAGRVLAFTVTPAQMGDLRGTPGRLAFLLARGTEPVIPNNPTRKRPHPFDRAAYRARTIIERAIGCLKDWRRVHTRCDKLARNDASAVAIAALFSGWCRSSLEPGARRRWCGCQC